MNTNIRNEYLTRDAIMKLLSDDEIARVSMREGGPKLVEGDEYVDLEHLAEGIRLVHPTTKISMGDVVPRSVVHDATWSKICAQIAGAGGRR